MGRVLAAGHRSGNVENGLTNCRACARDLMMFTVPSCQVSRVQRLRCLSSEMLLSLPSR